MIGIGLRTRHGNLAGQSVLENDAVIYYDQFQSRSVGQTLARMSARLADGRVAAITCLDSDRNPGLLTIAPLAGLPRIGKSIVFEASELPRLARAELFWGFDEVWLRDAPAVEPHDVPILTSERAITPEDRDSIGNWMIENGWSVGLGDGLGLNAVATHQDDWLELRRLIDLAAPVS
jgi:hypothetical protein